MIKKILVPVDGSNHARKAIGFACDLASKYDATVYLLHVMHRSEIPKYVLEYIKAEKIEESPKHVFLEKIGYGIIEAAQRDLREKGVKDVHSVVVEGDPAKRIIEFARDEGVDLIVMGSRGLGTIEDLFLGSVSHKVSHLAHCTCVMVK
jgi:nucleotide-binding universal stress UspA family protein